MRPAADCSACLGGNGGSGYFESGRSDQRCIRSAGRFVEYQYKHVGTARFFQSCPRLPMSALHSAKPAPRSLRPVSLSMARKPLWSSRRAGWTSSRSTASTGCSSSPDRQCKFRRTQTSSRSMHRTGGTGTCRFAPISMSALREPMAPAARISTCAGSARSSRKLSAFLFAAVFSSIPETLGTAMRKGACALVYEAHPMAFIVEQAGGGASTGRKRVLDIVPDSLHQRVPLIMGSIKNVQRLEHMHTVPDVALEANAPLFGNRGLFRV